MKSNNEAWRGSWEKNLAFNMKFIEYRCLENRVIVDLNVSTGTTSLAYSFATLTINWLKFDGLDFGDMFFFFKCINCGMSSFAKEVDILFSKCIVAQGGDLPHVGEDAYTLPHYY